MKLLRWVMIALCGTTTAVAISFMALGLESQHVEWALLCAIISMYGTVIAMYLESIYEKLDTNKP